MADFRLVSGRQKETRGIVLNRDERTMRVLLALEVNVSYSTSYLNTFHLTIKGSRLYQTYHYIIQTANSNFSPFSTSRYQSLKLFFIVSKLIDEQQYLLRSSCHHLHTERAFPLSLALRKRGICSSNETFQLHSNELTTITTTVNTLTDVGTISVSSARRYNVFILSHTPTQEGWELILGWEK